MHDHDRVGAGSDGAIAEPDGVTDGDVGFVRGERERVDGVIVSVDPVGRRPGAGESEGGG
ncbi:MAG: hypothetical protein ACOC8B_02185 [Gemmatimonadota bacterium]